MIDRNWFDQFLALISPGKSPAQAKVWTHNTQGVSHGDTLSMNLIIDWKVRNCIKEDSLKSQHYFKFDSSSCKRYCRFHYSTTNTWWVSAHAKSILVLPYNYSLIIIVTWLSLCNKTWRSVRSAKRRNLMWHQLTYGNVEIPTKCVVTVKTKARVQMGTRKDSVQDKGQNCYCAFQLHVYAQCSRGLCRLV